jgi:hypothetical protein
VNRSANSSESEVFPLPVGPSRMMASGMELWVSRCDRPLFLSKDPPHAVLTIATSRRERSTSDSYGKATTRRSLQQ